MLILVDLVYLCSKKSELRRTPVEMRALLAGPGSDRALPNPVPYRIGQRLGQERCDEIVRRYESGETARALADEFGVAKSALLNLFRRNNVVVRRRALTDEQVAELARDYQTGKTLSELEAETGVPHGTIQRALKAAGTPMRPRGGSSARRTVRQGERTM